MQNSDVEQVPHESRTRWLLVTVVLLLIAFVLVAIVDLVLEATARDAIGTLDPAFRSFVWYYLLPALSVASFALALIRRPGPADWLLGLGAVPLIGWLAAAQFMYRRDVGQNLPILVVIFAWCALPLVLLAIAAGAPGSSVRRRSLRLMALGIPVPLMAFLFLINVA